MEWREEEVVRAVDDVRMLEKCYAGNIMAQKDSSSASTLSTLGNNLSTTQSEAQLQTMNSDALLKAYKKHEADLENIKIYQKSKSCKI